MDWTLCICSSWFVLLNHRLGPLPPPPPRLRNGLSPVKPDATGALLRRSDLKSPDVPWRRKMFAFENVTGSMDNTDICQSLFIRYFHWAHFMFFTFHQPVRVSDSSMSTTPKQLLCPRPSQSPAQRHRLLSSRDRSLSGEKGLVYSFIGHSLMV